MPQVRPVTGCFAALLAIGFAPNLLPAQSGSGPVTRAQAIDAAIQRGPRAGTAIADTMVAAATLLNARLRPDPAAALSYSKAPPNYHFTVELPIDIPGVRGLRIKSADLLRQAAGFRFAFAQANAALDADTAYTSALLADALSSLSSQNARDADSLRRLAILRADAGDAAQLDVEVATLFAGQQRNLAAADSLTSLQAILSLRSVMGVPSTAPAFQLADSLTFVAEALPNTAMPPLPVVAATAELDAASAAVTQQQRSRLPWPSLLLGLDAGDPDLKGLLPVIGLSFPLPFFTGNRGELAMATAERTRAEAELHAITMEIDAAKAATSRTLAALPARIARDQQLLQSADRIAAMSLTAYREGAAAIASVLEAQRTVREVRAQYLTDLADAKIAMAILRALSASPSTGSPR